MLSTDIGGFGGLEPLISARLDPWGQGTVDGTLGSPRPTEPGILTFIRGRKFLLLRSNFSVATVISRIPLDRGRDFDPPVLG